MVDLRRDSRLEILTWDVGAWVSLAMMGICEVEVFTERNTELLGL